MEKQLEKLLNAKECEINALKEIIQHQRREIETLKSSENKFIIRCAEKSSEIQRIEKENVEFRGKIKIKNETIFDLRCEIKLLNEAMKKYANKNETQRKDHLQILAKQREKVKELQKQNEKLATEKAELTVKNYQLFEENRKLDEYETKAINLQFAIDRMRSEKAELEMNELLKIDAKAWKAENEKLAAENETLSKDFASQQEINLQLAGENFNLRKENERLCEKINNIGNFKAVKSREDEFFMLWVENKGVPTVRIESELKAVNEAARLCEKENRPVHILQQKFKITK